MAKIYLKIILFCLNQLSKFGTLDILEINLVESTIKQMIKDLK